MARLLILLEGGDGVGKSVARQNLEASFVINEWKVQSAHFPDYKIPTGKKIRRFLNGKFGTPTELDLYEVSDWYYENRKEFYSMHKGWFRKADVIILDRSHISNLFYQGVKFFDSFPSIPKELSAEHEEAISKLADYAWTQNSREQELIEYTQGSLDRTIVIPLYLTNGVDEQGYPQSFVNQTAPAEDRPVDLHDSDREYQKRVYDFAHLLHRENAAIIRREHTWFSFPILPPLYDYSIVKLPFEDSSTLYDRCKVIWDAILGEIVARQDSSRLKVRVTVQVPQPSRYYEEGSAPQLTFDDVTIGGKTLRCMENTVREHE